MKALILAVSLFASSSVFAYSEGEFFLDPHVGVGFNVAQGTYFTVGADGGYAISDQLAAGVGGYYAAGKRPNHDREIGGGPFASFVQPITSFLVASIREDLYYVDQRTPVRDAQGEYSMHDVDYGVASITSLGLHVIFTPNFGISGGYRAFLPLSNSDIGRDRSGTFLGFSIGI